MEDDLEIPHSLRPIFRAVMEAADDPSLPIDEWLHNMLSTADRFLAEHHVDWEPRAALIYFLKTPYLPPRR